MHQYYSLIDHLTSVLLIIIVGQINDVHANQISMSKNEIRRLKYPYVTYLDLKQSYCRDLRDCQTYFPCAVFSNGFSYLYVIKRCSNGKIFDEIKQKCVKNTFDDPACSKQTLKATKKSRLTTNRPLSMKRTTMKNIKVPLHVPSSRRTFDNNLIENIPKIETKRNNVQTKMHRVCYITNWSRYRKGEAKFEIQYIDPFMCSHIIYAYATIDDNKPEIIPIQKNDIGKKKFSSSYLLFDENVSFFFRCRPLS